MLESFLVAWDSSVLELDCMHSDFDFKDWVYREINIQIFSKVCGTIIFGLLDLTWKWSIHFLSLVMQMTLPKRHYLMDIRYLCICNFILDLQGKLCRDFAFSSMYLPVLNIICFLLAVLHPCFVYVFENFSCSFFELFLARDILVCVLWLEVSQGYSTDVDSLYKWDSCLLIGVAENYYYWTCLTFISDTGFFCYPAGRPCRGLRGWHEVHRFFLVCSFKK